MGITIPLLLHTSLHSRFAYPALDTPVLQHARLKDHLQLARCLRRCPGDSDSPDSPTDTAGTAVASSSGLATRLSYVTYTTTNVGTIVTSSIGTSRFITSLPPSLSTYTTQIPLETTLVPVLTPSVISGTTVVTTNTAGQEETTIVGGETISPTTN